MTKLFTYFLLIFGTIHVASGQNCPSGYVSKPYQDCPGALPLCNVENVIANNEICGEGAKPDEIKSTSTCGAKEHQTSWYQFKVRRGGKFRFRIIPNDVTNLRNYSISSGSTDYDWILYKLPTGSSASNTTVCNLLSASSNLQVSCNYSAETGVTGIYDSLRAITGGNSQGVFGERFNTPLTVNTGDFFILAVDNYDTSRIGYQILFDDPDRNSRVADIRASSDSAQFSAINKTPQCKDNRLIFSFSEPIFCQDISTTTFTIRSLTNPDQTYRIDSIRPATPCNTSQSLSSQFVLGFSPLIAGDYELILQKQIRDICLNYTNRDTIKFSITPFVTLSTVANNTATDSACCGTQASFVASVNPALNARPFDFGYSFFSKDSTSGAYTPIEAISGLRADTNKLYAQLPCTNPPVRQKLFIKVIASNPRLGCADSAFASFRFNPTPVSSFARVPGLCFGESVQIALNEPQDTGLYVYTWSSKTPTPKLGRKGIFTLTADTTNAVDAATGDVRRGKNDEFNVKVAFKKKFGGCAIKDQKQPVFVGSYLEASLDYKSVERPGKPTPPDYVFGEMTLYDRSKVRTIETTRGEIAQELWTIKNASNITTFSKDTLGPIDSLAVAFDDVGPYTISVQQRQVIDTVGPDKVCTSIASKQVLVFVPQVPNIMTRNSDNANDYFEVPVLRKSLKYKLIVYNRWGRKVIEKENYDNTFKGDDLAPGTYFYSLAPTAGSGASYKGWLELTEKE